MMNMKAYKPSTHIAVRDCDDDLSDDVEDDVFIRDRKSRTVCEENGLKRPLMAPRRKVPKKSATTRKSNVVSLVMRKQNNCWKCCEPFVYAFSALVVLISLIFVIAYLLTIFPVSVQKIKIWLRNRETAVLGRTSTADAAALNSNLNAEYDLFKGELTPCTQINVHKIWSKSFSSLNSESPVRKCDVSNDGIDDIIIGFHVDDNIVHGTHSNVPKCEVDVGSYRQMVDCRGGVIALDGKTGETLWQRWTSYHIFSLHCKQDLNLDEQPDCIASGRGESIIAINSRNGEKLWEFKSSSYPLLSARIGDNDFELFTINGMRDIDDDRVPDILAVHLKVSTNDDVADLRKNPYRSSIQLISGQTGKVIRSIPIPYQEDVYVPLQLITRYDGTESILLATGGQNSPGGLYLINLFAVMQTTKENQFTTIFRNPTSGFMVPPILADINNDGTEDIITALFNSTVYAFNGRTLETIWKFIFPTSESISSIVPGHYNHDNVPDFMIKYSNGPGFPVYYYSQTQIVNGIDGTPLLEQTINDSGGPNSLLGGLSISQTFGGDLFLHWQTQCRDKIDVKDVYQFIPGSDVLYQSRADTCMLRYNQSTILKLYAITRHVRPPGAIIFSTDDLLLQLNETEQLQEIRKQIAVSALKHPKMFKKTPKENLQENLQDNQRQPLDENNVNGFQQPENGKFLQPEKSFRDISLPTLSEDPVNSIVYRQQTNDQYENPNNYGRENYRSKNRHTIDKQHLNQQQMHEKQSYQQQQPNLDEYENYYDEIRSRNYNDKYSINRGIRSELNDDLDSTSLDYVNKMNKIKSAIKSKNRPEKPETLWDLEMEKEEKEEKEEFNDLKSSKEKRKNNSKKLVRRNIPNTTLSFENSQGILPAISSVGVLLKSIDNANSTLDFVFVLTVRESELYPPLFLPEDVTCIQEQLNSYRSEVSANGAAETLDLERNFLKGCLESRLPNLAPHSSKYDSQIVITRLSIKCVCGTLKTGEQCSSFKSIDEQKWTEYMGNSNNGLYPNL